MPTNTAGDVGRVVYTETVGSLRKNFTFGATSAGAMTVGILPIGAIIVAVGVIVKTAFNFGTNNLLDIGVTGTGQAFASAISIATAGQIVADDMATSVNVGPFTAATTITATPSLTGTPGTTGAASVYVLFIMNNDQQAVN